MTSLFLRAKIPCSSLPPRLSRPRTSVIRICRKYATHRDPLQASQLSQSLDTKRQPPRPEQTVGPFQLAGESPFAAEKAKKWSDLTAGGKVKRTTARTSNLVVILLGAGLSTVLIYAVTSELFSKNSPTVLYSDCCEQIKRSPQVAKYLHGPLAFHTTRPSVDRPRHRNHQVTSQIFLDAQGREHMMMNFFVQGREHSSTHEPSESYLDAATRWTQRTTEHLSTLTLDEAIQWAKDRSTYTWEKFQRSFKYLIGAPASPTSASDSLPSQTEEHKTPETSTQKWTGLFSSLRRTRSEAVESRIESGTIYTDGEAHAEFIRNDDGYFVCRYILIDIPNSRSPHPIRVFVNRAAGVRENESVLRWNS